MELIQFYSGIIFLGLGAFLFFEERNFKKNLVAIKGRVIGYSKGKSKTNKRHMYSVIEFTHPNGERGWVESHTVRQNITQQLGAEVTLVTDKDDFHITRTSSNLSYLWAGVFFVLAITNLFAFVFTSQAGWMIGALTVLFVGALSFLSKESLDEQEQNLKVISAWRAWRAQAVKSRVYNESEVESIHFWDKEYCLKAFKRANFFKVVHLIYGCLLASIFMLLGLISYTGEKQFNTTSYKSTATIVNIISNEIPVFEYYDIEGVAHRALMRGGLSSEKVKIGNKFNVLYTSNNHREIRHDFATFKYLEPVMWFFFGIYICGIFVYGNMRIPKYDLNSSPIATAEELVVKKAS
ncbi:hypothetical protein [Pseudobdellovibrio sp. HCB154]|uniref:hypothetical protein n=1 Tax=Pseudobdellovibrio sp. HCB154 TaxID=3386277 RepID=UPI003917429D